MTRSITFFLILATLFCVKTDAQNDVWQHEYEGDIPIYIDSIQTYSRFRLVLYWLSRRCPCP